MLKPPEAPYLQQHARPAASRTSAMWYRAKRHKGVVLVITLLAVVLLAALVLYVFNLGQKTNARIAAQTEADSAANAGAAWVARSLNTVSMNNVAIARLITNVAVLDAMPMAVEFTYKEQLDAHRTTDPQGVSQAMENQLSRGIDDWWVREKVQEMVDRIGRADERQQQYQSDQRAQELRILESFDELFNAPHGDVAPLTFYNAPAGRGLLWQGMQSLDELSQLTMENLGVLAQLNAVRGAQINADNTGYPTAMMLPVEPSIPYKRGTFRDFERPIRNGLLPTDTDDKTTNRGPYDTVFGWRHSRGTRTQGHSDQTSVVRGSGRNTVPIGRGTDGDYVVTSREGGTAYTVYGPYQWMMYHAHNLRRNSLRYSRFDHWLRTISDIKLHYAFRGGPTRTIIYPEWNINYDEARTIAQEDRDRIVETAFVVVEVKSRYPLSQRPPASGGDQGDDRYWQYVTRHRPSVPWVTRQANWVDADSWNITRVNDHVWRSEWDYEVNFDRDLGLEPVRDENGQMVPHRVYRIDHYIFAGVNIGEPVEVRNPFNFPSRDALPAPTELDLAAVPPTNDAAHQHFLSYMSVVRHHDEPSLWPKLFKSKSPNPNQMAVAQAQVFNDHSWDLWTQMWRAQLSKIDTTKGMTKNDFSIWIDRLEQDREAAATIPDMTAQDAEDFLQYLRSVEELAPVMLYH